jgi:integrase
MSQSKECKNATTETNQAKTILKANCLESTKRLLEIFMIEKKLKNLEKTNVSYFFKNWVNKRSKYELIRPYRLNNMVHQTMKIVKFYLKDKSELPIIKQILKKLANRMARNLFTKKYMPPKKAKTFSIKDAGKIMLNLWHLGLPEKEAAIMMCFTFLCGNRVGDLQYTSWSDLEYDENKNGRWLSIPLKVSKTNPMSLKLETVTMKIKKGTIWDVEQKLNYLKTLKPFRKSDRIFDNRTTKSFVYFMDKSRKNLGFKTPISAHSGRNSVVERMLKANVSADNICVALNWTRGSEMLYRYRNKVIEKSEMGAQFQLDRYDVNNFKF